MALVAIQASPAAASVSRADQSATKAFIAAEGHYLTHALRRAGLVKKAATAFVDHVAATCQNSLASLPSTPTATQLATIVALLSEASFDFSASTLAPLAADLRAQSKAFSKLHWSRAAINHAVATYVRGEGEVLSTPATDLCSDIAAASATNFSQPGPGTIVLLNQLSTVPKFKDPIKLQKLMSPYLTAASRAEAKRVHRAANKLAKAIDPTLRAQANRLLTVLFGSNAPPGSMPDLPR
jgi:hypothetical protein